MFGSFHASSIDVALGCQEYFKLGIFKKRKNLINDSF